MNYSDEITAADYEDMSHIQLVHIATNQYNDLEKLRAEVKRLGRVEEHLLSDIRSVVNALNASRHQIALANTYIKVLQDTVEAFQMFEHAACVEESDYATMYNVVTGVIQIAPTLLSYEGSTGSLDDAIPF